jgi:hypothetical protein
MFEHKRRASVPSPSFYTPMTIIIHSSAGFYYFGVILPLLEADQLAYKACPPRKALVVAQPMVEDGGGM